MSNFQNYTLFLKTPISPNEGTRVCLIRFTPCAMTALNVLKRIICSIQMGRDSRVAKMTNSHLHYSWIVLTFPKKIRLWNINSDKFHFNDSSNLDDPGCDLWLKYYVLLLYDVTVYLRWRLLPALRSISTTYALCRLPTAVCVSRRTTYAGDFLLYFFSFDLASSTSLAWFGTLFYSLSLSLW